MAANDLHKVAELIELKNPIDEQIAAVIGRPAENGHVGEFIASQIFDIELEKSASHKGSDGVFGSGPLEGCTVNVKWYMKREGTLDLTGQEPKNHYYLVMTGARAVSGTSVATVRPWVIDAVGEAHANGVRLISRTDFSKVHQGRSFLDALEIRDVRVELRGARGEPTPSRRGWRRRW